jgi:nicotinamidase-related amidase
MRIIPLLHHLYRGYPADFSAGSAAAHSFLGWDTLPLGVDLDRTALLMMHLPDAGLRPESRWVPDCPRPDLLGTVEWVPRTMKLVTESLPPLVAAARKAGVQIVHITMGDSYAKQFTQRQRCIAELGDPPTPENDPLPVEPDIDWEADRMKRAYRLASTPPDADPTTPWNCFPPGLEPQGDDLVCYRTWELHRLLRTRNINNLIYTGWALNWCLWFSECGMNDMQRLRYRPYAVRGACVAIENAESADTEANLAYAYWMTAAKFGYILDRVELIDALSDAPVTMEA